MKALLTNERGTALVAALFFITALSLTATVIVWTTSSERRSSFNEFSHVRSFYSADAGTEQAINWLRLQPSPPAPVLDDGTDLYVKVDSSYTYIEQHHKFRVDVKHKLEGGQVKLRHRPGWDNSWMDFEYTVDSFGSGATQSDAQIEVQAARLFRIDYSY